MILIEIEDYIKPLERAFERNANKDDAHFMKKYMKGKFEYYGIKTPQRTEIQSGFLKQWGNPEMNNLKECIQYMWDKPQREFQYTAMNFLFKFMQQVDKDFIDFIEYLIVTKSWWDTVDLLAGKISAVYFMKYPEMIKPVTEKWMASGNMWLQRSALLFQLKFRDKTDEKLLYKYIKKLSSSNEFFIQKAIGWALREYSKTNPESVKEFIDGNKLAPLSVREGLKVIKKG